MTEGKINTDSLGAAAALVAQCKLDLWRSTGDPRHRKDAAHEVFLLGLLAGCAVDADNLLDVQHPATLIGDDPELLESWVSGLEDGRETRLSADAERRPCECTKEPPYECPNHFDRDAHALRAGREAMAWRALHQSAKETGA